MHIRARFGCALVRAAMFLLLAGCSSGTSTGTGSIPGADSGAGSRSASQAARPAVRLTDAVRGARMAPSDSLIFGDPDILGANVPPKSGVYAAQFAGTQNLYGIPDTKNAKPVCTIANSVVENPSGLGVDSKGTVWIPGLTNNGGGWGVATFVMNTCTQGKVSYTETNGQPSNIAFASTGTNYVADVVNFSTEGGSISVYPKGATSPVSTLTPPKESGYLFGIATDSKNNVYAAYQGGPGTEICVFTGGKGKGKVLQTSPDTYFGLTFDHKDNLIATNATAGLVAVFKPPYNGKAETFATKGEPLQLNLDSKNANLYIADSTNGSIDVHKYPSGTYEYSISNGLVRGDDVEGVAVDPSDNN